MSAIIQRSRADFIVLALVIAGFLLNIYAPIWFRPPLFEYTIWLYLILFFAWIPAYLLLLRGQRRQRLMTLTVIVGILFLSCACMTIRPNSAFAVTFLDTITCEEQPAPQTGHIRYTCTRVAFEGQEFNLTFVFDTLPIIPFMWRVEGDFRSVKTE